MKLPSNELSHVSVAVPCMYIIKASWTPERLELMLSAAVLCDSRIEIGRSTSKLDQAVSESEYERDSVPAA